VLALESLLGAGWLLYVILRKARRNPAKLPVPSLRPVLTYSGSLILRGIIGFCFLRINVFLVEAVSSTEEVGYYYLADRFFLVPQLLLGAYSAAIAPRIAEGVARKDWKAVAGLAHRSNGVVLLLSLPFVVGFVASRPLFSLSILEEFQKTWPVLALFGLSLPPVAMAAVATGGLMVYSGRAHIALIAAVVVAVLNVGLCLLLSGPYGATGAGIAVLAASWIGGSVEIALAYRILRMPFRIRFFS
jgi:putative peptidoglycan lipid II flippase